MYNLIHGKFQIKYDDYFSIKMRTRRTRMLGNDLLLLVPRFNTNNFKSWLSVKGIYTWNALPNQLRNVEPVVTIHGKIDVRFKKKLYELLLNKLREDFLDYSICTWKINCICHHCTVK